MKYLKESPLSIALVAGVGMFLSTLDSGIINIAIPTLLKEFNTPISTVIWTITLYTLTLSATILLFGRLADRIGRLKIYILGLALFAMSSFLCGASTNIWVLITFRALQGLSAAMMQATAIALITTRLDERGIAKAMGIFGMVIGLGPMMGPVLGGFILSTVGWRWIFWLNIPICLLGIIGCKKLAIAFEAGGAAMFIGLKSKVDSNALIHGIAHGWWLSASICILAWATLIVYFIQNRKKNVAGR